ncbi:MAG: hypothetical protein AAF403_06310 [Pseudomonadota bacterium]
MNNDDLTKLEKLALHAYQPIISNGFYAYVMPFEGQINLRFAPITKDTPSRKNNLSIAHQIEQLFKLNIPDICRFTQNKTMRLDWLAYDEFRLHVNAQALKPTLNSLSELSTTHHLQAVDVSDYYTQILITGEYARLLLANAITLDLHAQAFNANDIKSTHYAQNIMVSIACFDSIIQFHQTHILPHNMDDLDHQQNCFVLSVRWSYSDYIRKHLQNSTQELASII